MTIISLENISLIKQKKTILKDISWSVEKGEHWAILGLNGAGKSSLLKLITADYWQTSGQMEVLGTRFGQDSIPDLRQKIGIVSSAIAERFPKKNLSAEEIVLTGKLKSSFLYRTMSEDDLNEAREMLISIGEKKLVGRKYFDLSQGEKQFLLIARGLMAKPSILVLDEATNGLDILAREKLLNQIDRIAQSPLTPTIIHITHHVEEITPSFAKVMLLREGEIFKKGSREKLLNTNTLSDFYRCPISLFPLADDRVFVQPQIKNE